MVVFPNAKINIGLNILRKRPDNFHDIQTVFFPLKLSDALEIVVSKDFRETTFVNTGLTVDIDPEKNLVIRVYNFFKEKYNLPEAKIHLHKVIPFGAGLGGGSSDATFTAMLLNDYFDLQLSDNELVSVVSEFGADCPFFVVNKPAFATGIGEIIEPLETNPLKNYKIVLVKPDFHISTKNIFRKIKPNENVASLKNLIKLPVKEWKNKIFNDFEKIVFEEYPQLSKIKDKLYKTGALYAAMTGSGSAIYGIFPKNKFVDLDLFRNNNFIWQENIE